MKIKNIACALTMIISLIGFPLRVKADEQFQPYQQVYLSTLDGNQTITVFNNPAINLHNCTRAIDKDTQQEYCKEAVGWPDRNSKINIVDGQDIHQEVFDSYSNKKKDEVFVKVHFMYTRSALVNGVLTNFPQEDEGYLPKSTLTTKQYESFYAAEPEKKLPCPPSHDYMNALMNTPQALPELKKSVENFSVVEDSEEIYKSVGQCADKPATQIQSFPSGNVFDNLVLPKIKNAKIPDAITEAGVPMTRQDLITIDAFARSLYGEMGGCFSEGLQYPIAAACVAINRLNTPSRQKEWTGTNIHRSSKDLPPLCKILTTPEKFNNWMAPDPGDYNGALNETLCPPTTVGKPFWKEKTPADKDAVDVWKNSVRIATEAVLFPEKFKGRCADLKDVLFYTSGMGKYENKIRVDRKVGGREVPDTQCIELWVEPPRKVASTQNTTTKIKKKKKKNKKSNSDD